MSINNTGGLCQRIKQLFKFVRCVNFEYGSIRATSLQADRVTENPYTKGVCMFCEHRFYLCFNGFYVMSNIYLGDTIKLVMEWRHGTRYFVVI